MIEKSNKDQTLPLDPFGLIDILFREKHQILSHDIA